MASTSAAYDQPILFVSDNEHFAIKSVTSLSANNAIEQSEPIASTSTAYRDTRAQTVPVIKPIEHSQPSQPDEQTPSTSYHIEHSVASTSSQFACATPPKKRKFETDSQSQKNLALIAELEGNDFAKDLFSIIDQIPDYDSPEDVQRLESEMESLKIAHEKKVNELVETKEHQSNIITKLTKRCEDFEKDKNELEKRIEQLEKDLKECQDNCLEYEISNRHLENRLETADSTHFNNLNIIENLSRQEANLSEIVADQQRTLLHVENRLSIQEGELIQCKHKERFLEKSLRETEELHMQALKENSELKNDIVRLRNDNEIKEKLLNEYRGQNNKFNFEFASSKFKENINTMVQNARQIVIDDIQVGRATPEQATVSTTDVPGIVGRGTDVSIVARRCMQCKKTQAVQKLTLTYCSSKCKIEYL